MRGENTQQSMMFSLISPERRVPADHPLRVIKAMADEELRRLSPVFSRMYAKTGRPSVAPERLLKALLLIALYSVRSEPLFCEQLDYNMLFRWFLDMNMDDASFDASTFSQNRERLMNHEIARKFFENIVRQASERGLTSDDHFTVDGTLIEAWASLKSFRPKGEDPEDQAPPDDPGNPTVDFHGEKRLNDTHASTTDPEARLMRKARGKEARLSYSANALMENRNGLLLNVVLKEATGKAERETAEAMLKAKRRQRGNDARLTVAGDKGYDTTDFVASVRRMNVTPHVACNDGRCGGSALDERTTRHEGYRISQRIRKRVEEIFGWMKTIGGFRRTRYKGKRRSQFAVYVVGAAYNLLRISRLTLATA